MASGKGSFLETAQILRSSVSVNWYWVGKSNLASVTNR
jgi:hypothetical protein